MLCNVGSDALIICVADDGSNVFWHTQSGNTYSIYSMKNGVPERIGRITNSEKYCSVGGFYYNNGKSCSISSSNGTQLILVTDGVPNEIVLPGTITYYTMVNANGEHIDSDDDIIHEFYISVRENKDADQCALYKLSPDGSLLEIVDNIADTHYGEGYKLCNGTLYYVNTEGDLHRKNLAEEGIGDKITTDVDRYYVSPMGEYVYIVKSGNLYYWETKDETYTLHLISNSIASGDRIYLTNIDDIIYYTSDRVEIKDTYMTHGTLYRYKVGDSSITITSNVLAVLTNGSKYCDADHPIIRTYVSNDESDCIVNYGTLSEGVYTILVSDIEY